MWGLEPRWQCPTAACIQLAVSLLFRYRHDDLPLLMAHMNILGHVHTLAHAHIHTHACTCAQVFNRFDEGSKGWLRPEELGRLVEHFLPGGQITPGDVKYMQVRQGSVLGGPGGKEVACVCMCFGGAGLVAPHFLG